jgi:hypothetical protein
MILENAKKGMGLSSFDNYIDSYDYYHGTNMASIYELYDQLINDCVDESFDPFFDLSNPNNLDEKQMKIFISVYEMMNENKENSVAKKKSHQTYLIIKQNYENLSNKKKRRRK